MPPHTNDLQLSNSLDAIRALTAEGQITWDAQRHPIDGTILIYRGTGSDYNDPNLDGDGPTHFRYLLDDTVYVEGDEESGPSISRYYDDSHIFDAMVLAMHTNPSAKGSLLKLVRLVRIIATV